MLTVRFLRLFWRAPWMAIASRAACCIYRGLAKRNAAPYGAELEGASAILSASGRTCQIVNRRDMKGRRHAANDWGQPVAAMVRRRRRTSLIGPRAVSRTVHGNRSRPDIDLRARETRIPCLRV